MSIVTSPTVTIFNTISSSASFGPTVIDQQIIDSVPLIWPNNVAFAGLTTLGAMIDFITNPANASITTGITQTNMTIGIVIDPEEFTTCCGIGSNCPGDLYIQPSVNISRISNTTQQNYNFTGLNNYDSQNTGNSCGSPIKVNAECRMPSGTQSNSYASQSLPPSGRIDIPYSIQLQVITSNSCSSGVQLNSFSLTLSVAFVVNIAGICSDLTPVTTQLCINTYCNNDSADKSICSPIMDTFCMGVFSTATTFNPADPNQLICSCSSQRAKVDPTFVSGVYDSAACFDAYCSNSGYKSTEQVATLSDCGIFCGVVIECENAKTCQVDGNRVTVSCGNTASAPINWFDILFAALVVLFIIIIAILFIFYILLPILK